MMTGKTDGHDKSEKGSHLLVENEHSLPTYTNLQLLFSIPVWTDLIFDIDASR